MFGKVRGRERSGRCYGFVSYVNCIQIGVVGLILHTIVAFETGSLTRFLRLHMMGYADGSKPREQYTCIQLCLQRVLIDSYIWV